MTNDGGNLHYIYGATATNLPGSGQFSYAPVGGTRPTDSGTGAVGTLISGGKINVDFTAASLALTGLTVGFSNATYTMSGSTSIHNGLFSTSGIGAPVRVCRRWLPAAHRRQLRRLLRRSGRRRAWGSTTSSITVAAACIEGVVGYRRCAGAAGC